ncbi:tenascin isoform X2 [Oryzias melastigma]|uniref:tenascin isoform X2 n=1 Tax=Oryzias melastigma TaxID=30732 RepID=UPI000CF7E068|nr:tenascin isoform X2 [Oryzias melastigma]
MLFALGLVFLLTPLASSETTTNLKRDAAERNATKLREALNPSKPKIPASTQIFHPTPKPNTVNETILLTSATKLKPQQDNTTEASKSRSRTTDAPSVTAKNPKTNRAVSNKGKHLKEELTLTHDAKGRKGKLSSNGATSVQSTPMKSTLAHNAQLSTHKPQQSVNSTVPTVSNHGKTSKDEAIQNASSSSSSTESHSVRTEKITRNKPKQTVNPPASNVPLLSSHNTNKTIPSPPKKSHSVKVMTHKPPPSKNQTDVDESHSSHGSKTAAAEPVSSKTRSTTLVKITKLSRTKSQQPDNHTAVTESALPAHHKAVKNETTQNVPSSSKKSPSTPSDKPMKTILHQSNNHTESTESASPTHSKAIRNETIQSVLPISTKSPSTQSDKSNKLQQSDNPPVLNKPGQKNSKDNSTQTVLPTKTNAKISKGNNQTDSTNPQVNDTPAVTKPQAKDNSKVKALNKTSIEVPSTVTKKQPTDSQPVTVVICNGCDSSNNKDHEVKLSAGTPLVVTHKISLLPGGCTEGHDAKLDALIERVARLEKEMSFLKEQCPCSTKCPNNCSGNGRCEKGSCICQQGFMGEDCSKCKQGVDCNTRPANKFPNSDHPKDEPRDNEIHHNETKSVTTETKNTTNASSSPAPDNTALNKTAIRETVTRKRGGLGSVKVANISSHSLTVTWLAPQGMFKKFTVTKRELQSDGDKNEPLRVEEQDISSTARNTTAVENESTTLFSGKVGAKRTSVMVPGDSRSVEITNLQANTLYVLQVFGTAENSRSKTHRVTATTGPEPPTRMLFSNVTESSVGVSWVKPKTTFTGFRITYINIVSGASRFVTLGSKQSHVVLSKLSPGSSYMISITATKGTAQSDELTSIITTVPAPPKHLQVTNVTHNRALLRWTPSLGKVDRFIISYESSKTPNVTVTVMLSGTSVEHQLKGLQKDTVYTIKMLSQKDSLKSTTISTSFTTANVVKPSEVGPRSAVIAWKTPTVYKSYRVIYEVPGKEKKEVILPPTANEYKLTGLFPMSRYTVVVQGEKNGHYTSIFTSEFVTGKLRFPFPMDCAQELLNGASESGEVDIYPGGKEGEAVRVYCDMEADGGGWTVFQRRMNGKTDFYRTWHEYSVGFGNLSEEFWLGNELLHNLTSVGPVSLRVDLQSGNDTAYAHYTNFSVASEERNYTLTVSGYTGTAGNSMKLHSGRPFSTRDKDPDRLENHCAKLYMGGWWYKNCYRANLNGLYGSHTKNQGIVWIDWKGKDSSIPFTEMKFRPSLFSATHG